MGGGFWLVGGYPKGRSATLATLTNCTVAGNSAGEGGGLYVSGLYVSGYGKVTLANDTVESNSAQYYGGGLYVYPTDGGTVTLTGDTVELNSAGDGGGLYIDTLDSYPYRSTVDLDSFTVGNTINNKDLSGLNGRTANIAYASPP